MLPFSGNVMIFYFLTEKFTEILLPKVRESIDFIISYLGSWKKNFFLFRKSNDFFYFHTKKLKVLLLPNIWESIDYFSSCWGSSYKLCSPLQINRTSLKEALSQIKNIQVADFIKIIFDLEVSLSKLSNKSK